MRAGNAIPTLCERCEFATARSFALSVAPRSGRDTMKSPLVLTQTCDSRGFRHASACRRAMRTNLAI